MNRTSTVQIWPQPNFATLCLDLLLLFAGIGIQSSFAEEPEFVTLTDTTGKFKLEAKILGVVNEKVQLQTKDGRQVNVALNKLSPESLRFVQAAKSTKKRSPQQPAPPSPADELKTIPYPLSKTNKAEIQLLSDKMTAEGIAIGKSPSTTVPVSDSLAVSGVPASFIQALAARKLLQLQALGLVTAEDIAKPNALVKALAMDWVLPTLVVSAGGEGLTSEKPGPMLPRIRADGSLAAKLAVDGLPVAKPNLGRLFWNEIAVVPDHLPLSSLVGRFDPEVPVTEENAADVAEELVWSKALKISDGSHAQLAATRRALQAAIFELLQFEIGDPQAADKAKQKQAREQLQKARATFQETWDAGFAEPAK